MVEGPDQPPSMLTAAEAEFVYNVEALSMSIRGAARLAGVEATVASRPHVKQAREHMREELNGELRVSKEDIMRQMLDAVDRARLLSKPEVEIMGLREVGALAGHYKAPTIDVNLHATVEVLQKNIRQISTEDLIKQLDADEIIDVAFYPVQHGQEKESA